MDDLPQRDNYFSTYWAARQDSLEAQRRVVDLAQRILASVPPEGLERFKRALDEEIDRRFRAMRDACL